MGAMRSLVAKTIKRALARRGFLLFNAKAKFGLDPWVDINRLASEWNRSVDLFFDVGANDGETTIAAFREFPKARVIGLDPHPTAFSQLTKRMSGIPNFQGVNCALGSDAGEVVMFEYDGSKINSLTETAQFAVRFGKKAKRISVHCTTLDDYCVQNRIEKIDVLKIDTEGFDLSVLNGSGGMLKRNLIDFIYVEFNDLQPKKGVFGGALLPIDDLLRPYGYRFIASYNDYIVTNGDMFSVSNALFAMPPKFN